jgi:hypothetical protein
METLQELDRQVFYAINHGLHHPWLSPLMWLFTSLGWAGCSCCCCLGRHLAYAGGGERMAWGALGGGCFCPVLWRG